jgi:hypothetical protein
MAAPRNPLLDRLGRVPAFIRKIIWKLPDKWQQNKDHTVWVMAIDDDGHVLADYQSSFPEYHSVMGAAEHNGRLYLTSTLNKGVLVLALPDS